MICVEKLSLNVGLIHVVMVMERSVLEGIPHMHLIVHALSLSPPPSVPTARGRDRSGQRRKPNVHGSTPEVGSIWHFNHDWNLTPKFKTKLNAVYLEPCWDWTLPTNNAYRFDFEDIMCLTKRERRTRIIWVLDPFLHKQKVCLTTVPIVSSRIPKVHVYILFLSRVWKSKDTCIDRWLRVMNGLCVENSGRGGWGGWGG